MSWEKIKCHGEVMEMSWKLTKENFVNRLEKSWKTLRSHEKVMEIDNLDFVANLKSCLAPIQPVTSVIYFLFVY